jgi:cytochrome c oxidase subunit 2
MANLWVGFMSASSMAPRTDRLFFVLLAVFTLITVLIGTLMVYFCWRYRVGAKADRSNPPVQNTRVEIALVGLMLATGFGIFFWSGSDYLRMRGLPTGALEIHVYPKQWMWKFQHEDGRREIDELHVPRDRDVKLTMISQDVIHSFFVPAFRIKEDILPGRYTSTWFRATESGNFEILCAQYCGTNHSTMRARVVVMDPSDYERWTLGQTATESVANQTPTSDGRETGAALFHRLGCINCHVSGHAESAPELAGVWQSRVKLQDQSTVIANESYLRESILNPNAKVVRGYSPVMPTFQGLVSEDEVTALIAYLKSLAPPQKRKATR